VAVLAVVTLALIAFGLSGRPSLEGVKRSERLLAELGAKVQKALAADALNLEMPGAHGRELFAARVAANRLGASQPRPAAEAESRLDLATWRLEPGEVQAPKPLAEIEPWSAFFDQVSYLKHAKVKTGLPDLTGDVPQGFIGDDENAYLMRAGLSGLALLDSGRLGQIDARVALEWTRASATDDWRIETFRTERFEVVDSNGQLFNEVLDRALPDPELLERARESVEYDRVRRYILSGGQEPLPSGFNFRDPGDHHPGVSIVDVDRDGWDDLYIPARFGPNMMFRNRGDGTFEEIAAEVGLDLGGHVSSAIFADFDNDGDDDVFLGQTGERSLYLANEEGRFVDRSADLLGEPLPSLVTSVAAADFDNDGLLDLYLSTHAGGPVRRKMRQRTKNRVESLLGRGRILEDHLPNEQARHLFDLAMSDEFDLIVRRPGPPNLLLRNLGDGRFERFDPDGPQEVWLQTYQATPADFDGDGDVDLYLANDFAANNMLANQGDGTFVDVTEETRTADVGFGMGVSWADYDCDGLQDLYVTNMYSKAGLRITGELEGVSEVFSKAARGNSLLRNSPGSFEHVSGRSEPAMLVEKAGWGWGGQFVDADNDGFPDIYALSGFYTAPPEVAVAEDT
jgi:hypothetical protein